MSQPVQQRDNKQSVQNRPKLTAYLKRPKLSTQAIQIRDLRSPNEPLLDTPRFNSSPQNITSSPNSMTNSHRTSIDSEEKLFDINFSLPEILAICYIDLDGNLV